MVSISQYISIIFSPGVYVLSSTLVHIVIFEYKCMDVVFDISACTYKRTKIFLEPCLKQSIFTYTCMHVYARGYSMTCKYWITYE